MIRHTAAALFAAATLLLGSCSPTPNGNSDPRLAEAFRALGRGDLELCLQSASAVLEEHPGHPRASFILGLGLYESKRSAEALPLLLAAEAAAAPFPGRASLPYHIAWCQLELGHFQAAREAFTRHLAFTDEADSHFGLGVVALELGQTEVAQSELIRALVIFEQRVTAGQASAARDLGKVHARLADVALAHGRQAEAREQLDQAVALDPALATAWLKLHELALTTGDQQRADEALAAHKRLTAGD